MLNHKLFAAFLVLSVSALALFSFFAPGDEQQSPAEAGTVLGERTADDADGVPFNLFVEGLISKRKGYDGSNCDFVVSEEVGGQATSWEGELIWSDARDYKLTIDGGKETVLVSRGRIYNVGTDGAKEALGTIDDGGNGTANYLAVSNYVFDNFLGEAGQDPAHSELVGEETIDGIKYYILENRLTLSDPPQETVRKFWVSEDGVFFKAEIEDREEDYEVYDSTGTAVTQLGYTKHIVLEVKNRVFF